MAKEIHNHSRIENQVNIDTNLGDINLSQKSRFAKRFEKLNHEVENNVRYEGVMEAFEEYITKMDGIGLEKKLEDGGFSENEIIRATRKKIKYLKKQQKNRFYESAQWIDSQLFAMLKMNFETYIEPLVIESSPKSLILKSVVEKVINPAYNLINTEGENDRVLNYTLDDVFGMVYYLTGLCHLNWTDYENV
jgi:hypothetical protein